jgi:hypothetical protein
MVDGAVGRLSGIEVELLQQSAKADSGALVPDADPDCSVFVMDAHCDHRPFEARVSHSWHRQEQLAGQESGILNHALDNAALGRDGQELRKASAEPICPFT